VCLFCSNGYSCVPGSGSGEQLSASYERASFTKFGSEECNEICLYTPVHNEDLHNSYYSPSLIRMMQTWKMRWAGHVARMGEKRNAYKILMGKPEVKTTRKT
jgi:hypothetical protein